MKKPPSRPTGFRGTWLNSPDGCAAYSEGAGPYRIVPAAVAIPDHREDLVCAVRDAQRTGHSLIPRGAGSGMPGGNIGEGVVVDCTRLNRPLRVSAEAVANVPAGVTVQEICQAASHLNLRFPPNPSSSAFATIGGMVATNAAGPNALRYGSVRPWIRGVELITADGDVGWVGRKSNGRHPRAPTAGQAPAIQPQLPALARFEQTADPVIQSNKELIQARTPATSKNSAGYACAEYVSSGDVLDILIGSEGTLGFITRVETSLEIVPAANGSVSLGLASLADLAATVEFLTGLRPSAIEWLDRTYLELTQAEQPNDIAGVLLVDFERDSIDHVRGVIGDAVRGLDDVCRFAEVALTSEERERIWSMRAETSAALARLPSVTRSLQIVEDGCVPRARVGDLVGAIHHASDKSGLRVVVFGHAGDGHLHVNTLANTNDARMRERLRMMHTMITEAIATLGGTVSGEHGDGRLRPADTASIYGPELVAVFKCIKDSFDPNGIFNPSVILGAPRDVTADLKVGSTAAPIPEYIESQLRSMEQNGGWGTPKHRLTR